MISNIKPTVAGLFVGCGGLDYGFQKAGYELVWANEISPDAAKSYTLLTGHSVLVDDVWNVIEKVPETDVIIGGPPCQSFSLVGKRLDNDPRGELVFAFQKVIDLRRPSAFVMENVPGLLASKINDERLHNYLARQFDEMGYEVSILKLTATDFFVPQKRQRVFMVGVKKGNRTFELINEEKYGSILGFNKLSCPVSVSDALDDLPLVSPKGHIGSSIYSSAPHSEYAKLMREDNSDSVFLHSLPTMSELDKEFVKFIPPGGNYSHIPDAISTRRILSFKKTGGRTTTYGRLHPEKPAYTINTFFNRPNVGANYHHNELRLITVREALRLQSFPDRFTPFYSNQRSLHMQVGNAVPPLMARAVAESLKSALI
ncbi:TPA: DNA cytosine methyltransferase [Enterobacter roggenkampii]